MVPLLAVADFVYALSADPESFDLRRCLLIIWCAHGRYINMIHDILLPATSYLDDISIGTSYLKLVQVSPQTFAIALEVSADVRVVFCLYQAATRAMCTLS